MKMRRSPGQVRDAIIGVLTDAKRPLTTAEIYEAVDAELGGSVAHSSIRSYLGINAGTGRAASHVFRRTSRGTYELVR